MVGFSVVDSGVREVHVEMLKKRILTKQLTSGFCFYYQTELNCFEEQRMVKERTVFFEKGRILKETKGETFKKKRSDFFFWLWLLCWVNEFLKLLT